MARGRHRTAVVLRQQASIAAASGSGTRRWWSSPWVAGAIVVVLVLGGLTAGLVWRADRCFGDPVVLSVVTSPDQQDVVRELAYAWEGGGNGAGSRGQPIDGHCGAILVRSQESAAVGQALSPTRNGAEPNARVDVWMPDSSTWITSAARRPGMASLLDGEHPSVASSPIVLAIPRPMADALGWPRTPISWTSLALERVGGRTWSDYGHPEWGSLRIGVGDPRQSVTALGTLLSVVDADGSGQVNETELRNALLLARAATVEEPTSAAFLARLRGQTSADGLLAEGGPFPATEQQVAAFDRGDPPLALTAAQPTEGTVYADYPYVTLNAPWVDPIRRKIAASFLDLLRSQTGREAYGRGGFRDPERTTRYAHGLQPVLGMGSPVTADARPLPTDEAITKTVVFWSALQRRANVLATIDTSGSMAEPVPDGSGSRLKVVQDACVRAITLFSPQSSVGLWKFSTRLDGDRDYRQLVSLGPIGAGLPDGTPRRAALETAIRRELTPRGATGLYDTMFAAFQHVQAHWQPNRLNLLVLMTDGKNEDDGLTRAQLIQRLRRAAQPDRPVQVIAIGFGASADLAELTEITSAVGGKAYSADSGDDIDKIFLDTLVGRD